MQYMIMKHSERYIDAEVGEIFGLQRQVFLLLYSVYIMSREQCEK